MKASFDSKEKIKPWLSSDLKRHQFLGKHFQFNIDFGFGIYIWNSELGLKNLKLRVMKQSIVHLDK